MTPTFAFLTLTPWEIIILLGIGVLLFGRKLPEMGKMLGKGLVEFKKGMSGMEDELMNSTTATPRHEPVPMEAPRPPQRVAPATPKFEEPTTNITTPPSA
jgi:sec-independent protein translocase protein TatA